MGEKIVWGLDIGGTKTALCAANEAGEILARRQLPTRDFPGWEALLETLRSRGIGLSHIEARLLLEQESAKKR